MDRTPIAFGGGALVLALGAGAVGQGYLNGDAAVYAAQALDLDFTQRLTHLVYLVLAAFIGTFAGPSLPWAMDLCNVLVASGCVVLLAHLARDPWVGALGGAACVLPWCAFAEVDLLWMVLLLAACASRSSRWVGPWVALSVGVSPTALLCVPWVCAWRGDRSAAVGAWVGVAVLTGVTWGAWWWGSRGVLVGGGLQPGRLAEAAIVGLPWVLCAGWRPRRHALWLAPLLMAPPDVPVWLFVAFVWVLDAEGDRAMKGLCCGALLWAWCGLNQRGDTVGGERRVLERVIEELGEDGGLVAPWSWGARASVLATGDPYGLRWRPPEGFVRDQARGWCGAPPIRVASLPPGASWAVGGEPDQYGVYWSFEAPTEGCPR